MQNVDFSRMIRQRPAVDSAPVYSAATPERRSSNRAYVTAFIMALLAFALGVLAGLRLSDRTTQNPVVYPDKAQSFANTRPPAPTEVVPEKPAAATGGARYLIKLGTFSPTEAEKLTEQLNSLTALDGLQIENCKHVDVKRKENEMAFSIPLKAGTPRSNVFLGCFSNRDLAVGTVEIVTGSGLPGTSQAKLYEIE